MADPSSEWTYVSSKKSKSRSNRQSAPNNTSNSTSSNNQHNNSPNAPCPPSSSKTKSSTPLSQPFEFTGRPPPIAKDLTLAKLRTEYDTKERVWKTSRGRGELLRVLDGLLERTSPLTLPAGDGDGDGEKGRGGRNQHEEAEEDEQEDREDEGGWGITQAICLGTGSFSRDNLELRKRSLLQFAAFLDLVSYLEGGSGDTVGSTQSRRRTTKGTMERKKKIRMIAQEPMYTPLDRELLLSLGVDEVIGAKEMRSATLQERLGRDKFLYEVFVGGGEELARSVCEKEVRLVIGSFRSGRDAGGLGKRLEREYLRTVLPVFEPDPNVFEGLSVWGRRSREEIEEDG